MTSPSEIPGRSGPQPLGFAEVADLQDQLFVAATDLDRLGGLLEDAARHLIDHFTAADLRAQGAGLSQAAADDLRQELAGAVAALQFQDMAAQMLAHTLQRIRGVADFLGARALADDEEEAAEVTLAGRHCPVAQREVDAGSIELF